MVIPAFHTRSKRRATEIGDKYRVGRWIQGEREPEEEEEEEESKLEKNNETKREVIAGC